MSAIEGTMQNIHEALWFECAQLHWELGTFEYLYSEDQSLTDVLNDTARIFFRRLQPVLWDSMVLRLCRMLDPSTDRGNRNLSLRSLLAREQKAQRLWLENQQSVAQSPVSVERLKIAKSAVRNAENNGEFARRWRDKRISHNDLDEMSVIPPASNQGDDEQLLGVTRGTLIEMRSAIEAIANAVDALSNPSMISDFGKFHGKFDAQRLLTYLEEGFLSSADQRKALLAGHGDTSNLNRGRVHEHERRKKKLEHWRK